MYYLIVVLHLLVVLEVPMLIPILEPEKHDRLAEASIKFKKQIPKFPDCLCLSDLVNGMISSVLHFPNFPHGLIVVSEGFLNV